MTHTDGDISGQKIGAFFDLDQTLISINSMEEMFWYYHRHCHISSKYKAIRVIKRQFIMAQAIMKYLSLAISPFKKDERHEVNKKYFSMLKGVRVQEYEKLVVQWINDRNLLEHLNDGVMRRLKKHKEDNAVTVLVSGTHSYIAKRVGEILGIQNIIATDVEVEDGFYTGKISNKRQLVGAGKAITIQSFTKHFGINLRASFAYTDHISDIKMLEVVGFPRVVPVDKRLIRVAISKNWIVLPKVEIPELCSP